MNPQGTLLLQVSLCRNKEHILILQRNVRSRSCQNALDINRDHLQRTVCLHTVHHTTGSESILSDTLGMGYQRAYRVNLITQLILTGTEDGTLDLHHVIIAVEHSIDYHSIPIIHLERVHLKLIHREDGISLTRLTGQTDRLLISIPREASRIFQQCGDTLVLTHLIEHRAFHLSGDTHQTVIGTYLDDITLLQTDITCKTSIEDVLVDIHDTDQVAITVHLDVTQRTKVVDTTCHIEGMEHGREGTEVVSTRCTYLTHHVNHDGAGVTHGQFDITAAIAGAQGGADLRIGTCHCQSTDLNRTIARHCNITLGRYGELERPL